MIGKGGGALPAPQREEAEGMRIAGLQKTTLLDYPGKVACTVFLAGCNFRCPFCQNAEILDGCPDGIAEKELFSFLGRRRGILDGVCVTGGEPLCGEIAPFLQKIKALGYAVKLDTNGAFPERLKALAAEGLLDFIAMDIKSSPARYPALAGVKCDTAKIKESAAFLMESGIPYEFRTTCVKPLHRPEDFVYIGQWLAGAKAYFLQNFRQSDAVPAKGLSPFSHHEMQALLQLVLPYIPNAQIRGE